MEIDMADTHPTPGQGLAQRRRAFLSSFRSVSMLARELDELLDAFVERSRGIALAYDGSKIVVRRTPERCAIQLGGVGLSASWIRAGLGFPGDGELLVMQWEGTIGSLGRPADARPATLVREYVLRAEATGADDWRWRNETGDPASLTVSGVVELCVDPLARALAGS